MGWSATKIKHYQWKPIELLYDILVNDVSSYGVTDYNTLARAINANETSINDIIANYVTTDKEQIITANKTFAGAVVHNGTATFYAQVNFTNNLVSVGTTKYNQANIIANGYTLTYPSKNGTFALVSDVTALDEDLQNQIDIGNSINITTVGLVATNITDNGITYTIRAKNDSNEVRSQFNIAIPQANTLQAGLLNATDKAKINAIANNIATALSTAKTYTDSKVARTNLVSVLGEATQSLNGLISAEDKRRLDVLYALLGESEDADAVVNTINEVLAIFNQYPEGTSLVNTLALKINYTDIVDNVTSSDTNKPLSANQGKVLKDLIDTNQTNIVNGTTIVGKANMDSEGNVIKDTYFNREDGFAVGLVSVTDYDEDTGEVTLEYNSSAVTNIAYDTNTGVITFTY